MWIWRCLSILVIMGWGQIAVAQTLQGDFKTWRVFTHTRAKQQGCYITGSPTTRTGLSKRPDIPYLIVAHRGANLVEVSVSAGYPYQDQSTVILTVDAKPSRSFFTSAKTPKIAWARNAADDKGTLDEMLQGGKITVAGKGQGKITSKDTYDLQGFKDAYARMQERCTETKKDLTKADVKQDAASTGAKGGQGTDAKASKAAGPKATNPKATKTSGPKATQAPSASKETKTPGKSPAKATVQAGTKTSAQKDPKASGARDGKTTAPSKTQDEKKSRQ